MLHLPRARQAALAGLKVRRAPGFLAASPIPTVPRPGLRPSVFCWTTGRSTFSSKPAILEKHQLDPAASRKVNAGRLTCKLCRAASSPTTTSTPPPPTIHEDIYTLPNILTFSRLVAAPFVGYFILNDQHLWSVGLFAYAGLTDLLDGYIARRWNKRTVVGTVIDPMADKTLMTILTVCLAIKGGLPVWVASIILLRDVGLAISAIYYRWISLPEPKTFSRYWDFSLPSAEVRPTTISKYNTALQLLLVGLATANPVIPADVSSILSVLHYVVATTTVWSGASYIYTKDAVKILNQASTGRKN
ncbi:hypothetical protein jhhlp_001164 [Lomentospora prolificans]|uniref:CDP-diacylglycerol--glycerol-3-phosphate 3-phosphatidyltransferase n=1 Tax=Lomentospora prolificans TaxID=41688 RepID=A0A2N3NHG2_9PEZI|nr:hypothetical protein jhhlp_001164 [Lomentospora prolificans]